jgi:hypothetical protein
LGNIPRKDAAEIQLGAHRRIWFVNLTPRGETKGGELLATYGYVPESRAQSGDILDSCLTVFVKSGGTPPA